MHQHFLERETKKLTFPLLISNQNPNQNPNFMNLPPNNWIPFLFHLEDSQFPSPMTSVSSSNWLDRLRLSRGFPTGSEPDLTQFLSSSSSGTDSTRSQTPIPGNRLNSGVARRKTNELWRDEVSNVLCDLFNMGEETSRTFSKKKSSRKQPNPRFFVVPNDDDKNNELCSSDDLRRDQNGLGNSSGDNSLNDRNAEFDEIRDDEFDLKSYSKNEVLVVDTSLPGGKFDGWVFRRNDDWKIKEKKGKGKGSSVPGGKKKRKLLVCSMNDEKESVGDEEDDQKTIKTKMKMMNKSNGVRFLLPADKGQLYIEKKDQPFKETADSLCKIPQKRCPCPRPPEKFGNESSPVILLKSIPLNNISEVPKVGKSSQKKCPKKMIL